MHLVDCRTLLHTIMPLLTDVCLWWKRIFAGMLCIQDSCGCTCSLQWCAWMLYLRQEVLRLEQFFVVVKWQFMAILCWPWSPHRGTQHSPTDFWNFNCAWCMILRTTRAWTIFLTDDIASKETACLGREHASPAFYSKQRIVWKARFSPPNVFVQHMESLQDSFFWLLPLAGSEVF